MLERLRGIGRARTVVVEGNFACSVQAIGPELAIWLNRVREVLRQHDIPDPLAAPAAEARGPGGELFGWLRVHRPGSSAGRLRADGPSAWDRLLAELSAGKVAELQGGIGRYWRVGLPGPKIVSLALDSRPEIGEPKITRLVVGFEGGFPAPRPADSELRGLFDGLVEIPSLVWGRVDRCRQPFETEHEIASSILESEGIRQSPERLRGVAWLNFWNPHHLVAIGGRERLVDMNPAGITEVQGGVVVQVTPHLEQFDAGMRRTWEIAFRPALAVRPVYDGPGLQYVERPDPEMRDLPPPRSTVPVRLADDVQPDNALVSIVLRRCPDVAEVDRIQDAVARWFDDGYRVGYGTGQLGSITPVAANCDDGFLVEFEVDLATSNEIAFDYLGGTLQELAGIDVVGIDVGDVPV